MKNIKKLLALSLLLSVPSMQYSMEDDAGFQQLAASAANAQNQAIDNAGNQVIDTVDKAIEKNWYSNWSYPAMPDFGLQAKLNAFNEGYVAPAVQDVGSRLQAATSYITENVGKPVWNAATGMYEDATSSLSAGYQGALDYGQNQLESAKTGVNTFNENYIAPTVQGANSKLHAFNEGYIAPVIDYGQKQLSSVGAGLNTFNENYIAPVVQGASSKLHAFNEGYIAPALEYGQRQLGSARSGLESVGKTGWEYGPRQIGEFAQNNPEAATAAGVAAVILGAYVWHRYTHPESGTPEEQKDAIKIVEDFKAQYPDAMEKAQALVQAEIK